MITKNSAGNEPATKSASQEEHATEQPTIVYTVGPKGGVGKSTVARLVIDGCKAAGRDVSIIQIDRAPTLPELYEGITTTIVAPSAEDLRIDPLSAVRVFEPLDLAVSSIALRKGVLVVDVGAGHNTGALLHFISRSRFDNYLGSHEVKAVALAVTTADSSAMTQTASVIADLEQVHPSAEIVPVLNAYGGSFRFIAGSPARKCFAERIQPALKGRRHLSLPAVAEGAWPLFEAVGMTFTEAMMVSEDELMARLGLSRAVAVAVRADVADFLAEVWPRLGAVVGFDVEKANG
ncbi:hypothetical protein PRN20_06010 [Devosia sp. ZB163]|uniref:hypothetical protein n=1 Tax=Devosia sp. ZB163 TaxID=3025938 RepID=UPI002360BF44|nr:hypothetical protein [Devosia sp. ZB163]MDC9823279.1 hypothetical protein [Devosia sp. ZB163]